MKQAQVARDSMCMLLYQIAFDWCVSLLNEKTKPRTNSVFASIRILDIFGFENLKTNAFPQVNKLANLDVGACSRCKRAFSCRSYASTLPTSRSSGCSLITFMRWKPRSTR